MNYPIRAWAASLVLAIIPTGATVTLAQHQSEDTPKPVRQGVAYLSAQRPHYPPLPVNPFPELKTVEIAPGKFVYDDSEVDYEKLESELRELYQARVSLESEGGDNGGVSMMCSSGGLCLSAPRFERGNVLLDILGAEEGARYDLFVCTNLMEPLQWRFALRTAPGQTNMSLAPMAANAANAALFQLGTLQDSDGDTLTDAFEALVSFTNPNVTDTLATATAANNAAAVAALTPQDYSIYVATYNFSVNRALIGNPNACDFPNSPINEVSEYQNWTNGVGGTFWQANRRLTCDPATQTTVIHTYQAEGYWTSNGTACVRTKTDAEPWSSYDCTTNAEAPPMPVNPPRVFKLITNVVDGGGWSIREIWSEKTVTKLWTGGSQFSTNSRLWLINGSAVEYGTNQTGTNVPSHLINVLDHPLRHPGTNYQVLPDNAILDITPKLPPEFKNFSYYVGATPMSLKLLVNGLHYPGNRVPPVEAGTRINVSCELDPPLAIITNYQWTIPNGPISNWVATANFGGVIPLPAGYDTNSSVSYYWWKAATDVQVRCNVTIEGIGMNAFARFDVQKPTASITASILSQAAADANYETAPDPALHFGDSRPGAVPGIRFERTHAVTVGWKWLQVVNTSRRQRRASDGTWERYAGFGLDSFVEYPEAGIYTAVDSPGMGLFPYADRATVQDGFIMFLMFKPIGLDSIAVPISQISWSWAGEAQLQNGVWNLTSNPNSPTVDQQSSQAVAYPPQWNDNFLNFQWVPEQ